MKAKSEVFFLSCVYDRSSEATPFLMGPYQSRGDAELRMANLQEVESPRRAVAIKSLPAERLSGESYLIGGTRLLNLARMPVVNHDGTVVENGHELLFPGDYFESSGETV